MYEVIVGWLIQHISYTMALFYVRLICYVLPEMYKVSSLSILVSFSQEKVPSPSTALVCLTWEEEALPLCVNCKLWGETVFIG